MLRKTSCIYYKKRRRFITILWLAVVMFCCCFFSAFSFSTLQTAISFFFHCTILIFIYEYNRTLTKTCVTETESEILGILYAHSHFKQKNNLFSGCNFILTLGNFEFDAKNSYTRSFVHSFIFSCNFLCLVVFCFSNVFLMHKFSWRKHKTKWWNAKNEHNSCAKDYNQCVRCNRALSSDLWLWVTCYVCSFFVYPLFDVSLCECVCVNGQIFGCYILLIFFSERKNESMSNLHTYWPILTPNGKMGNK